jgi:hypothetical protein
MSLTPDLIQDKNNKKNYSHDYEASFAEVTKHYNVANSASVHTDASAGRGCSSHQFVRDVQ